jgi:hypothetical protein
MTRALIFKELRQHWLAFLLVVAFSGIGLLLLTTVVVMQEAGSVFDSLRRFLLTFYLIGALVLCNRLVVREYQSKTQLFLEGLPVSRISMVAVKYLFGLILLLLMVTAAFGLLLLLSLRNEQLTLRFVGILAARSYAYLWCVYSCFFMMGFLGRYRVAIYVFGVLGAAAIETLTKLELSRFGPFALVDEQFSYERFEWPSQALFIALGLAAAFVTLTLILSLVREGSVATMLSEKMSQREKVLIAVFVLGFVLAVNTFDERAKKQPFDLPGALAASAGDVSVKVSLGASTEEQRGHRLAQTVANEVALLAEYLQLTDLPPIFIVQRRDLDADRFERAVLDGAEGLLVRANFLSDEWRDGRFLTWLIRELLILESDERVKLEPNMWVLDGFSLYWTCRDAKSKLADYPTFELRAAYGAERGFSADDVASWLTYRDRVGDHIASAVAWHGLISLQRSHGEDACRSFVRAMLDSKVPGDARGVWHEWQHPLPKVIKREAGVTWEEFVQTWRNELQAVEQLRSAELARLPKLNGAVSFESLSASTRVVKFNFTSDPPPPQGRFTLLHAELPPFDDEVDVRELHREELDYPRERVGDLPGSFARGTRFYATFAVRVEQLDCEIISGWTRQEMR